MFGDDEIIEQDARAGILRVHEWGGGDLLTVTEIRGDEFVVCCSAGRNLSKHASGIYRMAKRAGCKTILFHALRPGVQRMLNRFGFKKVGTDEKGLTMYRAAVV